MVPRCRLSSALAAHTLALLGLSLDGVHDLHEGRHHLAHLRLNLNEGVCSADGSSQVSRISAVAAASLCSVLAGTSVASRALADEFALRLRAGDWLLALPVALGSLAHRGADSVGCFALSTAVGRRADSFALRAILLLAQILRAADVALRLVAMDLALSAFSLFAMYLALWSLAHRMAYSRAYGIITLPSALRVAITLDFSSGFQEVCLGTNSREREKSQYGQQKNSSHCGME